MQGQYCFMKNILIIVFMNSCWGMRTDRRGEQGRTNWRRVDTLNVCFTQPLYLALGHEATANVTFFIVAVVEMRGNSKQKSVYRGVDSKQKSKYREVDSKQKSVYREVDSKQKSVYRGVTANRRVCTER